MPDVSQRQRGAMEAAAHGNSTLGIPKKVGQEFVRADKREGISDQDLPKRAARGDKRALQAMELRRMI